MKQPVFLAVGGPRDGDFVPCRKHPKPGEYFRVPGSSPRVKHRYRFCAERCRLLYVGAVIVSESPSPVEKEPK